MRMLIAGRALHGVGGAIIPLASSGLFLSVFSLDRSSQIVAWKVAVGPLGLPSVPPV